MTTTNQLPQPKNQTQELLYMLLNSKNLTRKEILLQSGILNPTARIANLRRKGVVVGCENIKVKNKFDRTVAFGSWSLTNKEEAKDIYRELQSA